MRQTGYPYKTNFYGLGTISCLYCWFKRGMHKNIRKVTVITLFAFRKHAIIVIYRPKGFSVHLSPLLDLFLKHIHAHHNLQHFIGMHRTCCHPFPPSSPIWFLLFRFSDQNLVCFSSVSLRTGLILLTSSSYIPAISFSKTTTLL